MNVLFQGGTADIIVHEKQFDGTLTEIQKASGGPWGGIYVDEQCMKMWENIFGEKTVQKMKTKHPDEYLLLVRDWEIKKRDFKIGTDYVTLSVPVALLEKCKGVTKTSLKKLVSRSSYGDNIVVKGSNKLRITSAVVHEWFDGPINSLIEHLRGPEFIKNMPSIKSIILVGGFAESVYVQEKIKEGLPGKTLIVPPEAGLAVVKGAVQFGHKPNTIQTRVMHYTYGVNCTIPFDEAKHPETAVHIINDKKMVDDTFSIFVRFLEDVNIGNEKTKTYAPIFNQPTCVLKIFRTLNPDPVFVHDPGCEELGKVTVKRPDGLLTAGEDIYVTFMFGDTELKVKAKLIGTGEEFFLPLNCLDEPVNKSLTAACAVFK